MNQSRHPKFYSSLFSNAIFPSWAAYVPAAVVYLHEEGR
jgi:hypothetical protein